MLNSTKSIAAVALVSTFLMVPNLAFGGASGRQCTPLDPDYPACLADLPEPETIALFAVGLAGLIISRRKKK